MLNYGWACLEDPKLQFGVGGFFLTKVRYLCTQARNLFNFIQTMSTTITGFQDSYLLWTWIRNMAIFVFNFSNLFLESLYLYLYSGSIIPICSGSPGSGSFYHQVKIVWKKNWFLLFCNFFMTFNQCSVFGSVWFWATQIRHQKDTEGKMKGRTGTFSNYRLRNSHIKVPRPTLNSITSTVSKVQLFPWRPFPVGNHCIFFHNSEK